MIRFDHTVENGDQSIRIFVGSEPLSERGESHLLVAQMALDCFFRRQKIKAIPYFHDDGILIAFEIGVDVTSGDTNLIDAADSIGANEIQVSFVLVRFPFADINFNLPNLLDCFVLVRDHSLLLFDKRFLRFDGLILFIYYGLKLFKFLRFTSIVFHVSVLRLPVSEAFPTIGALIGRLLFWRIVQSPVR